jgi:hypothetical protein
MHEVHGERRVDNPADIQVLGLTMYGALGAAGVGVSYARMDDHTFPNIDKQAKDVAQSLGEIQKSHPSLANELHSEYLNSQTALGNHSQSNELLPKNFQNWGKPLTEAEAAAHDRWKGGLNSLNVIDTNSKLTSLDARSLANKFTTDLARPPFAREIKLVAGMEAVSHPVSDYNKLVSGYNDKLNGILGEEQAFKAADMARVRSAGKIMAGSLALDTVLDYTLLRDKREGPLTIATDFASPFVAGILHRYVGAAAFALPAVAHIAVKGLYEPTDASVNKQVF